MRMFSPALTAATFLLSSNIAHAQLERRSITAAVKPNTVQRILWRGEFNSKSCETYEAPTMKFSEAPKLGSVTTKIAEEKFDENTKGGKFSCIGKTTKRLEIFYKSNGQPGRDSFSFYILFASGWSEFVQAEVKIQ